MKWYGIDLPHVIEYRKGLLEEAEREELISGDAFEKDWIEEIRKKHPDVPLLIVASGLFYYFEEEKVLAEEPFYAHIPKKGLQFSTKVSMVISDRLSMVKMIHLSLNG